MAVPHAGAALITQGQCLASRTCPPPPSFPRGGYFYALVGLTSAGLAVYGLRLFLEGQPLWLVRLVVGLQWGALIVVLYLPLHFLAFYVRQTDAHTGRGLAVAGGLAVATVLSTAVIGRATLFLVPFLILLRCFACKSPCPGWRCWSAC